MFFIIVILLSIILTNKNKGPNQQVPFPTLEQKDKDQGSSLIPEVSNTVEPANEQIVSTDSAKKLETEGYIEKDTLCYSYKYPSTFEANEDNDCYQYIDSTDIDFLAKFTIEPVYESSLDRQSSIEDLISSRTIKDPILETEDLVIDGVPAKQILEKVDGSPINQHKVTVFVYIPGKYYRLSREVKGITFSYYYSDDYTAEQVKLEQDIFQDLLKSLKWK